MSNKLIIAAAGSGKTTYLVQEALKIKDERVLITTYTIANGEEIRKKLVEENQKQNGLACIPSNITVQTWFSFLLQHGARPFQGCLFEKRIKGLVSVNGQSGFQYYQKPCDKHKNGVGKDYPCSKCQQPRYYSEDKDFEKHYFTKNLDVYTDKLAKFAVRCNSISNGAVMHRIERIYQHIYIDEVQDLAGYDLDILKLLFRSQSNLLLVGDPRQGTYSTNNSPKNKKYRKSGIIYFFEDTTMNIETDDTSLLINHRCNCSICNFSNKLFPNFKGTTSDNMKITGHDGVFFIRQCGVDDYLSKYSPIQLRDSKRTNVNEKYPAVNFGESKGLSFDRILIYPTKPIINYLIGNSTELASTSHSRLYVAITRARYSVGIVVDDNSHYNVTGIEYYNVLNEYE
jgi:hypothetical protein